jgi:phosphate transport system permease protein
MPTDTTPQDINAVIARRRAAVNDSSRVRSRYRAEARFRLYGLMAILFAIGALCLLFTSIIGNGYTAFVQTEISLEVELKRDVIDPRNTADPAVIGQANFRNLVRAALYGLFPDVQGRGPQRRLASIISPGASFELRKMVMANPSLIGQTITMAVPADDDIDQLIKGNIDRNAPEANRRVNDEAIGWVDQLEAKGLIGLSFNHRFFTNGDSRDAEIAGILAALVGSILTMIITLVVAFPLAVAAAVYLEEFAPKENRWVDIIEVNINNLAAVPSIVFGLLGLAVFINFFELPRSAPLVGGLVLALMTLPTIIIASRAALKAVPPSIREAALGVGASPLQTVTDHVLPLAMPGILTGTIIGMAQALGETAPLLLIGMVAFIVDIPGGFGDPAAVLPVQIFLWADSPERAFVERTSAAIMVLLAFLISMNALAIFLRKKFERRW